MRASFWIRTDRPLACRSGSMQRPVQTKLFQLPARAFEDQSSVDQSDRGPFAGAEPATDASIDAPKSRPAALDTTGNTRAIFALPLWTTGVTGTTERALLRSLRGRRLMLSSCGDGRPSRRFGQQIATDPISSGTRVGHGREIGPRFAGPEIARQCGAAVRQERPSGQPGGLFLRVFPIVRRYPHAIAIALHEA